MSPGSRGMARNKTKVDAQEDDRAKGDQRNREATAGMTQDEKTLSEAGYRNLRATSLGLAGLTVAQHGYELRTGITVDRGKVSYITSNACTDLDSALQKLADIPMQETHKDGIM